MVHFVRWSEQTYGQPFDPAEIISRDLEDWIAHQQTVEKAAVNTINSRIVGVSQYFGWTLKQKLIKDNPAADVACLRTAPRQPRALDKTYVRRLLRHISKSGNVRDIAIAECLLGAGLRVSELLNLQLGDVTLNKRGGQVVVRRGKGAVHRVVPLTAKVRRALQKYLDQDHYLHAYREDNPHLGGDAPLWIGERGPLTDRTGIYYLLKKYARFAGLDETLISPHSLRHTFAARYLEKHRGDLRGLAAILGHATVNTTMVYTEPSTSDLARRMEEADI
jgi:integrase/recombinase XerD